MRRALLVPLLLAALVLPACGDDKQAGSDADKAPSRSKPTVTVPDGSPPKELQVKDIEVGTGAAAKNGDTLTVHYVGVSWSTKEQFDSSWEGNRPYPVVLGAGRVIRGWDQGLVGMKAGGRRQLIIPPDLGYGANPDPNGPIKPNETLVFVVDLVNLESR